MRRNEEPLQSKQHVPPVWLYLSRYDDIETARDKWKEAKREMEEHHSRVSSD